MIPLLLAVSIAVVFGRAARGSFLFDDPAIKDQELEKHKPDSLFYRGAGQLAQMIGSPRVVTHIFYLWIWRIAGYRPIAWHTANFLFHWISCVLLWNLADRFLDPERAAFAALIFAIHPLQSWTCYISAMSGIMSAMFAFAGLLLALDGFWHVSTIAFLLSCKSKQDGWLYALSLPIAYFFVG